MPSIGLPRHRLDALPGHPTPRQRACQPVISEETMRVRSRRSVITAGGAALTLAVLSVVPVAAQGQPPAAGAAAGQGWGATTTRDAAGGALTLDEKQVDALRRVSMFFNELKTLRGNFTQTNPDGKRLRGKFALKQPGRFRFDYGFGSKLIIVSDGRTLAIQDKDISTDDRLELDRTPFRMLLRNDVDLLRDARILEVQEVDDLIIVGVADKSPDTPGKIRLFLGKKPQLELREWVTTDVQGAETRVEVADPTRPETIEDALFKIEAVGLSRIQ
jgi:outer membrane lipoprotein-sorting protein